MTAASGEPSEAADFLEEAIEWYRDRDIAPVWAMYDKAFEMLALAKHIGVNPDAVAQAERACADIVRGLIPGDVIASAIKQHLSEMDGRDDR